MILKKHREIAADAECGPRINIAVVAEQNCRRREACIALLNPQVAVASVLQASDRTVTDAKTNTISILPQIHHADGGWMCVDNSAENPGRKKYAGSFSKCYGKSAETFFEFLGFLNMSGCDRFTGENVWGFLANQASRR